MADMPRHWVWYIGDLIHGTVIHLWVMEPCCHGITLSQGARDVRDRIFR